MKIKKEELKKALEIVKPGLANKEVIEQSTSFAFINGYVKTYNDEISISHPINIIGVNCAIKAEELYKFISKIKNEEISIELEKESLVLKAGKATAGFLLENEIKLPVEDEIVVPKKWKPISERFIELLKFVAMSSSSDLTDPKLTCVHVSNQGYIEASDNYRICHAKIDVPTESFLIPADSVNIVVKLKPNKISISNGWVHFKTEDNTVISCRTFNELYVDTTKILKSAKKGIEINLPKNLNEILERAIIFSKKENIMAESITISIDANSLLVESKSETSWFKEKSKVAYDGDAISFELTPHLLKDIVNQTDVCLLNNAILYFKGEDWTYITTVRQ